MLMPHACLHANHTAGLQASATKFLEKLLSFCFFSLSRFDALLIERAQYISHSQIDKVYTAQLDRDRVGRGSVRVRAASQFPLAPRPWPSPPRHTHHQRNFVEKESERVKE